MFSESSEAFKNDFSPFRKLPTPSKIILLPFGKSRKLQKSFFTLSEKFQMLIIYFWQFHFTEMR